MRAIGAGSAKGAASGSPSRIFSASVPPEHAIAVETNEASGCDVANSTAPVTELETRDHVIEERSYLPRLSLVAARVAM